jgi:hypothetical protein
VRVVLYTVVTYAVLCCVMLCYAMLTSGSSPAGGEEGGAGAREVVGRREGFQGLTDEYASAAAGFIAGISGVAARYSAVRRVLGDGNCFYR